MPNEVLPSATITTLFTGQWDSGNVPTPVFFDTNSGLRPIRIDFRSSDYLEIEANLPTLREEQIGFWVYANLTENITVNIYTRQGRQRLYNLMREVRRICHVNIHDVIGYQRIQFRDFDELVDIQQGMWAGQVRIELTDISKKMNTTD